ncbi:winged helix-turn-helix transcriptional regulator [Methanothrix sp.]|uniref:winged helix-turn-helix transcriptional regulator n=1 Tax=Methanothrix sp. TaxID=90426 RepID=UPI0037439CCC
MNSGIRGSDRMREDMQKGAQEGAQRRMQKGAPKNVQKGTQKGMQEAPSFDNRSMVLDYISHNPGSHMRKIARDLDMRLSTLRYHLDYLEKKGSIVCQRQNNLKVYFVQGKLKPMERTLAPLLQQKRFRDIILILIGSPGLKFSQIVDSLSISPSTASKHIRGLRKTSFNR